MNHLRKFIKMKWYIPQHIKEHIFILSNKDKIAFFSFFIEENCIRKGPKGGVKIKVYTASGLCKRTFHKGDSFQVSVHY